MQVCGIDDAGRGSMLGPLVIAGVRLDRERLAELASLGVRDSKRLSPASRERLYGRIIDVADDYCIFRIPTRSIDASVRRHGLNTLEARHMARVVSRLSPDTSYVDSCDVNPRRFGRRIAEMAGAGHGRIRSYHHADDRFVVVSAASILAKVARDRAVARLRRDHDLGSGYPSDSTTVAFVARYYEANSSMPAFVRKSWRTTQRIIADRGAA